MAMVLQRLSLPGGTREEKLVSELSPESGTHIDRVVENIRLEIYWKKEVDQNEFP
jgi:hypothetical protein